ncbi:MAG TPA: NAD(P)-dependent oxidoreductase [Verrucomicrobiota bacterium]|nr:NAD(P)-dependent oxidoreductase [Verrucomicrobiota bacterium]HQL78587.1 NAD(P)-dependent oxidoreductase [Verrucomicrobiota bacterium]
MSTILITGAGSFTGAHLARHLNSTGAGAVVGSDMPAQSGQTSAAEFQACDIRSGAEVSRLVDSVQPDTVYHLAGVSDENDPSALIRINLEGAWNLLEACRRLEQPPRVLLVGSAAGYGAQPDAVDALREDMPACPTTLYGFSREAELALGQLARRRWGLPVFLCRVFNLIGPGLSERYAPAAILRRLLACSEAAPTAFPLRNGHAIRDFVDVRDVVRAYSLILERGQPGMIYNIGTGQGVSLLDLTTRLARIAGRPVSIIKADGENGAERSAASRSIANHDRLTRDTGWQPEIPLEQSLADMARLTMAEGEARQSCSP